MSARSFQSTPRPTYTPWGYADQAREYGPGVWRVHTPSHGGVHLSPERNALVPSYMRNENGWYEEDVDVAKVAVVFPDLFTGEAGRAALDTLRNSFPDEYQRFTGKALNPGDSYVLDQRLFWQAHADSWVVRSAWGSWEPWVPEGKVGVCATQGEPKGGVPPSQERYFLVDAAEYETRFATSRHGYFVIDETRHAEIPDPYAAGARSAA